MVSDYIEEQVLQAMSERVGKLVPGGHSLALINAVNLLPLGPLECGCLAYQSMAFYNGTLKGTDPLTVSSSLFSRLYLRMLQYTNIDDSSGSGDNRQLMEVAERLTQAKDSTSKPSSYNGGVCAAMTADSSAPISFVPAYEATWTPDPDTGPLVIDIDAWRPGPTEKWQQGKPPAGIKGECLQAKLRYSDIRICTVTPKALSGREGWYDAELVEGMKTGRLGSVSFKKLGGFPKNTTAIRRASAFVVVGSVRFCLYSGSNFDLPKSPRAVNRLLSDHRTPTPPIRISCHLSVPSPTPVMHSARLLKRPSDFNTIQSHWDSGDLYKLTNAGFVIGVAVDAPFTF